MAGFGWASRLSRVAERYGLSRKKLGVNFFSGPKAFPEQDRAEKPKYRIVHFADENSSCLSVKCIVWKKELTLSETL